MDKEFKEKYKRNFIKITTLVNEFDPCGLIKCGAPSDEYESLTNYIMSHLYNKTSRKEVKTILLSEIEGNYGGRVSNICLDNFLDKVEKIILE